MAEFTWTPDFSWEIQHARRVNITTFENGTEQRADRGPAPDELDRTREQAKYRVHCKGCGRDSYYFRAGKVVKSLRRGGRGRVRCAFCGSDSFELYVRN